MQLLLMERPGCIALKILNSKKMYIRLFKCIKAWILWILIMVIPASIFRESFYIDTNIWDVLLTLFIVSFATLLFCENLLHLFNRFLNRFQFLTLSMILVLFELICKNLPSEIINMKYNDTWLSNSVFILFTLLASLVISRYIFNRKSLVIIEKEI